MSSVFRTWVWSRRSKLYQTRHTWSDGIRGVGLTSDEVEPCHLSRCCQRELALLVAYVDDLLLCCQSERAEKIVEKAIGKAVPLKETGIILPARHGGGQLISLVDVCIEVWMMTP